MLVNYISMAVCHYHINTSDNAFMALVLSIQFSQKKNSS